MALRKKDRLLLGSASGAFAIIMIALAVAGEAVLVVAIAAATALILIFQLRLSRAQEKKLIDRSKRDFQQIQSLFSLWQTLRPIAPMPTMRETAASPDFLCLLIELVRAHRPRMIVEAGSGTSTLVQAYMLKHAGQGHILSLDHEALYAGFTARNLSAHELDEYAQVVHAPINTIAAAGREFKWYEIGALADVGRIDMLVVDGPPKGIQAQARYPALPLLMERLSDRAIIVLDDADRPDERAIVDLWLKEYPEFDVEWVPLEKGACVLRRRPK